MIRNGDMLTVGLITANALLICLFVMSGAIPITSSGTFTETHATDLVPPPLPTVTPSATARPSPGMVLAVNEDSPLFAVIRSTPRNDPPAPTVTPAPSPTTAATAPSYNTALKSKQGAKATPSFKIPSIPKVKWHK